MNRLPSDPRNHPGSASTSDRPALRLHGDRGRTLLVYLPGVHGDWTLSGGLRAALGQSVCFAEFTYPRTLTATLNEYADAVDDALSEANLTEGWVLAESFGSQVAWALLAQPRRFITRGLVLAGGFVRHPFVAGARFGRWVFAHAPLPWLLFLTRGFAACARLRDRCAGVTESELDQFLERRTEADRQATVHRLGLIIGSDWRDLARTVRVPVYCLTGLVDPIVPWPGVVGWLRRQCPGFQDWRVVAWSDHHILGWAPRTAADQLLGWMTGGRSAVS